MRRRFHSSVALSGALLAGLLVVLGDASASPLQTPTSKTHSSELWAVDAVSSTDVWAVGDEWLPSGQGSIALTKHYDGVSWRTIATPVLDEPVLRSVAAAATDDVWAVGDAHNGLLVLHWDGISWQRVSTPDYPELSYLYDVDVIQPNRVIATGYYHAIEGCPCGPIRMTWNGSAWQKSKGRTADLVDVSARSSDDAWGVGLDEGVIARHWDGQHWADTATNPQDFPSNLQVVAVDKDSVWVSGTHTFGQDSGDSALQHWDGHTWTRESDGTGLVLALGGSGSRDVWAGGYADGARGLLEHWDGKKWSNSPNPATSLFAAWINGIDAISSQDAWAVGMYNDGANHRRILMHWDGSEWTMYRKHP
jgi:hypothetical protein